MQTGVIVRRNPDQFIPNAYLDLVIKHNSSAWGGAIIDGEDGLKTTSGGKEDLNAKAFRETMETFPNRAITFFFASSDNAVNDGDVFPQVLLSDDKDNPLMCVFVDANLPGFEKKDSSVAPATHFVDDWLRPKLGEIAELADGDVDKIMAYCGKDTFRKDILSQAVSRGAITLMSNKTTLSFSVGDTSKEYPWGWTSNHYGFEMQTEKAPEPAGKKNMFAKKGAAGPVADKPSDKPVSNAAQAILDAAAKKPQYRIHKSRPDNNMSRNNKKAFYETRIGYYPEGGDKSVEIECYVDQNGKLLPWAQVKRLGLEAAGLPKLTNPPRMGKGGNTDAEHIEGGELQNQPQKVSTEILPIMPPATREHILKNLASKEVQKIITETGDIVATAEQAKAMEAKFADFVKQLGSKYTNVDFLKLPYEWFLELGRAKPDGLAILTWNWKNMLAARLAKEATKPVVQPAELEPEKIEEPIAAPAAKKNMFAKKEAKAA